MLETHPPVHLRTRGKLDQATERFALRAALTAAHLLGLATGTHLRKLRELTDPLRVLQARLEQAELRARLAWEAAEILAARFARIPERHRPHYSPTQRFRILEIRSFLTWSAKEVARVFLVCPNTILNWENSADPNAKTVGSTVSPIPPVRRAADVVRSTAAAMVRYGLGGQDLVARTLAGAGWKVSARSVGRYSRRRSFSPPPAVTDLEPKRRTHPVIARFVHHTWMMDVSVVKQLLGPELYMAAVFDAWSRAPLALRVFDQRPTASDMARLMRRAVRAFAQPRYVITDLGGEFTAGSFRRAVKRLGAKQRFASEDSLLATARLERFWRTLKESAELYRLQLPLNRDDLEQRLELALFHYVRFRPHEGLEGATPLEAFLGAQPAHLQTIEPPRGMPGEGPTESPFRIAYLDPVNRRFAVLVPAA